MIRFIVACCDCFWPGGGRGSLLSLWRSLEWGALGHWSSVLCSLIMIVPTVSVSGNVVVPLCMPRFYHYTPTFVRKSACVYMAHRYRWACYCEHDWDPAPRNRRQWISRQHWIKRQHSRRRKGSRYPTKVTSFWRRRQGHKNGLTNEAPVSRCFFLMRDAKKSHYCVLDTL